MSTFEQLRQQVTSKAGRDGYALVRRNTHPYGWDLVTARERQCVISGALDEIDRFLDEAWADPRADRSGR
ncbi:hypothetical protein V7968_02430 [Nocardia vulneris]|uniref:hypothetical protein n=1 Tax=Nocardia vulneris TaxID=1141657 RepID=UPI0030CBC9B5